MRIYNCLLAALLVLTAPASAQYFEEEGYSYRAVASQTDPVVMEKLTRLHEQKIPYPEGFDYGKIICAMAYAEKGNLEKIKYWLGDMKRQDSKLEATVRAVDILIKNQYYDQAVSLLVPYVVLDYTRVDTMSVLGSRPVARKLNALKFYYDYAWILYKRKDYDAADAFMVPILHLVDRYSRRSPYYDLYALLLTQKKKMGEAGSIMLELLRNGTDHDELFMASAQKLLSDEYQHLVDSVNTAVRKSTMEFAKKYAANIQLPNTPLKDLNGKDFYLKSLKGKTVLLYIWTVYQLNFRPNLLADLKKAKEYYAKDPNIVFIAVHSFEQTAAYAKEASEFLKKNGCKMDLYFDLRDKASGNNPLATALKIHDEGTVLVINKDGVGKYMESEIFFNQYTFEKLRAVVDVVKEN